MRIKICLRLVSACIVLFSFSHTHLYSQPDTDKYLVLVGTADTKHSFHGRWLTMIYSEVANRLGLTLDYRGYPATRASKLSDAGFVQGEIHRVYSYANVHPNMVRIEESHFSINFVAYSHRQINNISSWHSLDNRGFSVAYRAGVKKSKSQLSKLQLKQLITVADNTTGIKMLAKQRFDIYVDVEGLIDNAIQADPSLSNIKKTGHLEEIQTYAFVHKKYRHLIPKISRALQAMKKEGLIENYKKLSLKQE